MDRNLDLAEQALQLVLGGRRESEASFLRNLMGDIDAGLQTAIQSPARLFRTMMSGGGASEDLAAVLEIVARPSERRAMRFAPGTGCCVSFPDGRCRPSDRAGLGRSPDIGGAGGGRHPCRERAGRPVWPGHRGRRLSSQPLAAVRPPLARQRGRVPPHSMILRPRFSQDDPYLDHPAASPDQPAPYAESASRLQEQAIPPPTKTRVRDQFAVPFRWMARVSLRKNGIEESHGA